MGDEQPDESSEPDSADEPEETYTLTLEDATPDDFLAVMGGVGEMAMTAMMMQNMKKYNEYGKLSHRIMRENRELARETLLDEELTEYLTLTAFPEELRDDLGLHVDDDGNITDIEGASEVEIE